MILNNTLWLSSGSASLDREIFRLTAAGWQLGRVSFQFDLPVQLHVTVTTNQRQGHFVSTNQEEDITRLLKEDDFS